MGNDPKRLLNNVPKAKTETCIKNNQQYNQPAQHQNSEDIMKIMDYPPDN